MLSMHVSRACRERGHATPIAVFTRGFLTWVRLTYGCEPSSNPPMDVG